MKAKLFGKSYDEDREENECTTYNAQDYCVEGKVHFTRIQIENSRYNSKSDSCLAFRPCDGRCKQGSHFITSIISPSVEAVVTIAIAHGFDRDIETEDIDVRGQQWPETT